MRLIDADELIEKAYSETEGMNNSCKDFGTMVEWLVDKMPTIELTPKKGKWYFRDTSRYGITLPYICTVCGEEANYAYDFCPNCGADMRREKQDGRFN